MNPKRVALLLPIGLALGFAFLWLSKNPPGSSPFLPGCPFYRLTSLHCPGCGMTRATHLISKGELGQAFLMNPLAMIILPFVLYCALAALLAWITCGQKRLPILRLPIWSYWLLLIVIMAYGIVRNIPTPPFDTLAPKTLPSH